MSAPDANGWMPIETAEKNSSARLVWVPENKCIFCVTWDAGEGKSKPASWQIFGGGWRSSIQGATHWLPLPKPPETP